MQTLNRRFWIFLIVIFIFFVLIGFLPYLLTRKSIMGIDFTSTGGIGDTIGGIMGPFIAIGAAFLTFFAFWIQFVANIQQREQFRIELERRDSERVAQERTWRIERFENRFYELVRLHKSNVEEMEIASIVKGRKCFVQMFYELRHAYSIVVDKYNSVSAEKSLKSKYRKINKIKLAYTIFFTGIGENSEKQFVKGFTKGEENLFQHCKEPLQECQRKFTANLYKEYPAGSPPSKKSEKDLHYYYYPFDGHANLLGHYYRHLFQTVSYVISQPDELLNFDQKYEYVSTLRAQLSNYEQLMLYYNALAWFSEEWRVIMTRYRFIKNIPLDLADFDISPEKHFKKEIEEMTAEGTQLFELR